MKHFKRKIKNALVILSVCLIVFVGFSRAGILFSEDNGDVITVSTSHKKFDSNKYAAAVALSSKPELITTTTIATTTIATTTLAPVNTWSGIVLTKSRGVVEGPSGKETYYNLKMGQVVENMRNLGFSEAEYPYSVREDGVKMLGDYVMVAADLGIRPKGTIVQTSLGYGIVCDTGEFAKKNQTQLDIAVSW